MLVGKHFDVLNRGHWSLEKTVTLSPLIDRIILSLAAGFAPSDSHQAVLFWSSEIAAAFVRFLPLWIESKVKMAKPLCFFA